MLILRILGLGSVALVIISFLSLAVPMTGSDAAGNGMASGFLFVGILALAAVAGVLAFLASFFVKPLDTLTKVIARGPFSVIFLLGGSLALGIWLS